MANAARVNQEPTHTVDSKTELERLLAEPVRFERGLEPKDDDTAWRLCERVAKVKMCGVTSAEDAYARVLFGRSIGLPAMASIDGIRMFWSKQQETNVPCAFVKVKLGICLSRPDVIEYIRPVSIAADKAICVGKRRGQPEVTYEFSMQDAETAGLVNRGRTDQAKESNNYNKHPKAMLWWRACGRVIDIIASDLLLGLSSREDIESMLEEEPETTTEPAAPEPPKVPERYWSKEADALKTRLTEAITSDDKAALKTVRADFKKFHDEAPVEIAEDILKFYNLIAGKKPGASANGAASKSAEPAPAKSADPYLPPHQRGDSYAGPDEPPTPF